MKIDEIYAIENGNENCIHLVRDRLFWQAWEKSAYYFVKMFRPYQVHNKFVQKIGAEMVWLGFPKCRLPDFEIEAKDNGFNWNVLDENHIVISGCTNLDKFEQWKQGVLSNAIKKISQKSPQVNLFDAGVKTVVKEPDVCRENENKRNIVCDDDLLRLYRIAYDLCLYVFRTTAKVSKNFKFGLADKVREEALTLTENLHLGVGGSVFFEKEVVKDFVCKTRVKFRLLCDLQQISTKQWIFINKQLEELQNFSGQSPAIQGSQERAYLVQ